MAMVLLEAISARSLIVCSDIPENVEVVGSNYPFLFSIARHGDLADKMKAAINSRSAEEETQMLYARCEALYAWSAISQKYVQAYNLITATR
jgi:glycosyltransferase involved in cell wall biosynthesis